MRKLARLCFSSRQPNWTSVSLALSPWMSVALNVIDWRETENKSRSLVLRFGIEWFNKDSRMLLRVSIRLSNLT